MIWLQGAKSNSLRSFDAVVIFARQLAAYGIKSCIDDSTLPDDLDRARFYDAAPYLTPVSQARPGRLVVIGAEHLDKETLAHLRSGSFAIPDRIDALGRFETLQHRIDVETKLSYALGTDIRATDLNLLQDQPIMQEMHGPCLSQRLSKRSSDRPSLHLFLERALVEEPITLPMLEALWNHPQFDVEVIVAGAGKSEISKSRISDQRMMSYSELPPDVLSHRADMFAIFGTSVPGERMAQHAANLIGNGRPVIDCTEGRVISAAGLPVLTGPGELATLSGYLEAAVLPNLDEIHSRLMESQWVQRNDLCNLLETLDLEIDEDVTKPKPERILFMPTNGNGLGHARRALLVADELKGRPVGFAAFPSCVPMINRAGFGCEALVSRSDAHAWEVANDILNYLRLRRLVCDGSTFVFDGGYVFESVMRTLAESGAKGIWIRRGLWRPEQMRSSTIEREKAFEKVIVPQEAFGELNKPMSFGKQIETVGPIVSEGLFDAKSTRERLCERLGRDFEKLVVSMLGGGVAADRSAQSTYIAALAERRKGVLHVSVAWPGAVIPPGLFGWSKTQVVQTQNALDLAAAADLVVSAVGYNSFHESLYNGIPTIFVPQLSAYMDDQERRARSAKDRGLAEMAMPGQMAEFERIFDRLLDGGADDLCRALSDYSLPVPGNSEAAQKIAEVHDAV